LLKIKSLFYTQNTIKIITMEKKKLDNDPPSLVDTMDVDGYCALPCAHSVTLNEGVLSKMSKVEKRRYRKSLTKALILRGAYREGPVCWLISNSQLLNYVSWPNIFRNYSANNNDIFSKTFNLIDQMTSYSHQPVERHVYYEAAEHFCKYVNSVRDSTIQEQKWNLGDPQDARESCGYFFNMLIDLRSNCN